ncbi:MAG: hypothetical protein PHQ65_17180 [Bacteroidales bacterium]|nr:hypothetical protein [Bacteroidales bacterium]
MHKEYLESILDRNSSIQYGGIEELGKEAILSYKIKYGNFKTIIYGSGSRACYILAWLRKKGIVPEIIVDGDIRKKGKKFYNIPVIHIDQLKENLKKGDKYLAIIAVGNNDLIESIKSKLINVGVDYVTDFIRDNAFASAVVSWQHFFLQHRDETIKMIKKFADNISKDVYCEFIRTIFYDDFYRLQQLDSRLKYMGDGLFDNREDEDFVCLGGSTGDTIFYFIDKYNEFSSITCFEGDKDCVSMLEENLKILPEYYSERIIINENFIGSETTSHSITLDATFESKRVSLISMDIEGAEMSALYGGKKIIKEQLPILGISAYHRKEDIFEIVSFISSISSEYRFYLRKYKSLHCYPNNEIVLYAIPEYRITLTE